MYSNKISESVLIVTYKRILHISKNKDSCIGSLKNEGNESFLDVTFASLHPNNFKRLLLFFYWKSMQVPHIIISDLNRNKVDFF